MAKKLNVQTGAEAKAFAFTDFDKPWGSRGESFTIDAFGHEKDAARWNRWKPGQEILNFGQIGFG